MTVDPEVFATAEAHLHSESQHCHKPNACRAVAISTVKNTVLVLSKTKCQEETHYHFVATYSSRMEAKQANLGFITLTLQTRFLSLFDWFCVL